MNRNEAVTHWLEQDFQQMRSNDVEDDSDSLSEVETVIESNAAKRSIHTLNWKIVALGKQNTNKSNIINGLLGQKLISYLAAEDYFEKEMNGVQVRVWDIDTDSISIKHYETVCTADTTICFLSMATTMGDHTQTIKSLSKQFGQRFWERCVIILCASQQFQEQESTNRNRSKAFEKEISTFQSNIRKALLSFNPTKKIQIVPSGKAGSPHLPGCQHWFSNICWRVLGVSSESSQTQIAEIFEPRITLKKPDDCGELYSQSIDLSVAKEATRKYYSDEVSIVFIILITFVVALICARFYAVAGNGFVIGATLGILATAIVVSITARVWKRIRKATLFITSTHEENLELMLRGPYSSSLSIAKRVTINHFSYEVWIMVITVVVALIWQFYNMVNKNGFVFGVTLGILALAAVVGVTAETRVWKRIREIQSTLYNFISKRKENLEPRVKTLDERDELYSQSIDLSVAKRVIMIRKHYSDNISSFFIIVITIVALIGMQFDEVADNGFVFGVTLGILALAGITVVKTLSSNKISIAYIMVITVVFALICGRFYAIAGNGFVLEVTLGILALVAVVWVTANNRVWEDIREATFYKSIREEIFEPRYNTQEKPDQHVELFVKRVMSYNNLKIVFKMVITVVAFIDTQFDEISGYWTVTLGVLALAAVVGLTTPRKHFCFKFSVMLISVFVALIGAVVADKEVLRVTLGIILVAFKVTVDLYGAFFAVVAIVAAVVVFSHTVAMEIITWKHSREGML